MPLVLPWLSTYMTISQSVNHPARQPFINSLIQSVSQPVKNLVKQSVSQLQGYVCPVCPVFLSVCRSVSLLVSFVLSRLIRCQQRQQQRQEVEAVYEWRRWRGRIVGRRWYGKWRGQPTQGLPVERRPLPRRDRAPPAGRRDKRRRRITGTDEVTGGQRRLLPPYDRRRNDQTVVVVIIGAQEQRRRRQRRRSPSSSSQSLSSPPQHSVSNPGSSPRGAQRPVTDSTSVSGIRGAHLPHGQDLLASTTDVQGGRSLTSSTPPADSVARSLLSASAPSTLRAVYLSSPSRELLLTGRSLCPVRGQDPPGRGRQRNRRRTPPRWPSHDNSPPSGERSSHDVEQQQ